MAVSLVSTGVQFPDSSIQTTAASASPMVFISSTIVTSSTASVSFTGLSNSTYAYYIIEFSNVFSTSEDVMRAVFSDDNGATYYTSGYNYLSVYGGSGVGQIYSTNGNPPIVAGYPQNFGTSIQNSSSGLIQLHNVGVSGGGGMITYTTGSKNNSQTPSTQIGNGGFFGNTTYNAVRLAPSSASFSGGNFYLYGVKKS